ncbi:putative chorismate pyruvate-lyase [Vibrio sp. MACH09]|uniref:chorismate lyase n=1 Tax=Vibrio sp. MACH09 TaxID=3025122 RepID=UPI002792F841|nr:chorismate lyase [Vibrio sp. MACH09]GLO62277.1 putative chorismate pyruvate-lyase [Vibrio sp. MACH09]
MNELISLYIAALGKIDWQDINQFEPSDKVSLPWLLEKGSLSRRLEKKCEKLTVNLLNNIMIPAKSISESEKTLLSDGQCLLREVVLFGDEEEWVVGRTLIPASSLDKQPYDLAEQGDIPLGLTVFSVDNVSRDALQVGWVDTPSGKLIARRSRLWMNDKPMLVAELFLPHAPIYSKEKV